MGFLFSPKQLVPYFQIIKISLIIFIKILINCKLINKHYTNMLYISCGKCLKYNITSNDITVLTVIYAFINFVVVKATTLSKYSEI